MSEWSDHTWNVIRGTFGEVKPDAEGQEQSTVADITEHNAKQEWESNNSKEGRVSFFVFRDAISVNNQLETFGDAVVIEEGGWSEFWICLSWHQVGSIHVLALSHFFDCTEKV